MADALSKPDPTLWRTRPRAPMPGTVLAPLEELADGAAKEFVFRGQAVFGYLNICPHYSSPLNHRAGHFLNEDGSRIRCTMHFAEFRIEDGFGVAGAAQNCWLDPVPVHVEDGNIVISRPGGQA